MTEPHIELPAETDSRRVKLTVPPADFLRLEKLAAKRRQPVSTVAMELVRAALNAINP